MGRTKEEAPKTYSLRVTEHALLNIDNITGYIAYIMHEPLNAIRAGDEILKTFDRIVNNPLAFRECEEKQNLEHAGFYALRLICLQQKTKSEVRSYRKIIAIHRRGRYP